MSSEKEVLDEWAKFVAEAFRGQKFQHCQEWKLGRKG